MHIKFDNLSSIGTKRRIIREFDFSDLLSKSSPDDPARSLPLLLFKLIQLVYSPLTPQQVAQGTGWQKQYITKFKLLITAITVIILGKDPGLAATLYIHQVPSYYYYYIYYYNYYYC